jgi:hypothetical protein
LDTILLALAIRHEDEQDGKELVGIIPEVPLSKPYQAGIRIKKDGKRYRLSGRTDYMLLSTEHRHANAPSRKPSCYVTQQMTDFLPRKLAHNILGACD